MRLWNIQWVSAGQRNKSVWDWDVKEDDTMGMSTRARRIPQAQLWSKPERKEAELTGIHFPQSAYAFSLVSNKFSSYDSEEHALQIGFCTSGTVCQRGRYNLHAQLYWFIKIQWGSGDDAGNWTLQQLEACSNGSIDNSVMLTFPMFFKGPCLLSSINTPLSLFSLTLSPFFLNSERTTYGFSSWHAEVLLHNLQCTLY